MGFITSLLRFSTARTVRKTVATGLLCFSAPCIAQEHDPLKFGGGFVTATPNVNTSYEQLRNVNQSIDDVLNADSVQFDPGWWQQLVSKPLSTESTGLILTLDDTLVRALDHSKQVKVFSELPLIRETAIIEADSAFDWTTYLSGRWDDVNDPIGNSLTAGGGLQFFED